MSGHGLHKRIALPLIRSCFQLPANMIRERTGSPNDAALLSQKAMQRSCAAGFDFLGVDAVARSFADSRSSS